MNRPYLKFLDIYYGAKCNLACSHCDTRSDIIDAYEKDPTLDNILDGIDLVRSKFDILYYSVLGGEPLLYLDKIEKIFSHIRQLDNNATFVFSTNGMLLDKKLKKLSVLLDKYKVNLFVCDHFAAFEDKTLSTKVRNNTELLAKELHMAEGDEREFFSNFLDVKNTIQDPLFQKWLDSKSLDLLNSHTDDRYFTNGNTWIHFRGQKQFQQIYNIVENKPKPFATGNPEESYRKGCCSEMCSFLIDKKLYKCGALGTLHKFLAKHNQLEDPDWQKYLNYQPLDLESCTHEQVQHFSDTKYSSISQCDMCPTGGYTFIKTPDKVLKTKNV